MMNHSTNSTPASSHCDRGLDPPVAIDRLHVAARAARGENEAADVGVLRVDAHVDDSKDRVGVGRAGDYEDAHAAAFGVEQDGHGVVAERSGE